MKSILAAGILGLTVIGPGAIGAQVQPAPPGTFEVASIRRNDSLDSGGTVMIRPGGTFVATNSSARSLIGMSHGVPAARVLGAPAWADAERYVVEARADGITSLGQAWPLVIEMLRDRFKLAARKEKRDLPVYTLVPARTDGRLGPGLRKAAIDCQNPEARKQAAAAAPEGTMVCGIRVNAGLLQAGGTGIVNLVPTLSSASGRPVIDRTGLTGEFDFELRWAPTPDVDGVSVFTAVEEQLGLKLESGTAPLDVVVVERLERPTEN